VTVSSRTSRKHPGRYKPVFTPVGWQVVDTVVARDPVAELGTGTPGYRRAVEEAVRLNAAAVSGRGEQ